MAAAIVPTTLMMGMATAATMPVNVHPVRVLICSA